MLSETIGMILLNSADVRTKNGMSVNEPGFNYNKNLDRLLTKNSKGVSYSGGNLRGVVKNIIIKVYNKQIFKVYCNIF